MPVDLLNIGLGFLEGFALIISPCILPILPIILAGSLTGSKRRPLGIILGFVLVFSLFTFFSRKLVQASGIDLNLVRHLSYGLLLVFGVVMVSTYLGEKFTLLTQRLANVGSGLSSVARPGDDFLGGLIFGGLVAVIWTPCAGPILAAVIVQTVLQQTNFMGFLTVLSFGAGAATPMLIIVLFGRNIMPKFSLFKTHALLFRKLLGLIIIATVVYMVYFETSLGAGGGSAAAAPAPTVGLEQGLAQPYPAPQVDGISAWINSKPLRPEDLKGKVVLIDFWTYSCINCIRTLPYLKDWYAKYHDRGFVIIGVHSPEFDFEKDLTNVKNAVAQDGILYPVALDNQFVTWQNFHNSYWPAHYLINKNGEVVYTHFGEGDYDVTENNIRFLLGLQGPAAAGSGGEAFSGAPITPETYFGYARAARFASPETVAADRKAQYSFPQALATDSWALRGAWVINASHIVSADNHAALELHFAAKKVFIVMGSGNGKPTTVSLLLDGKPLVSHAGKDVKNGVISVGKPRLYEALVLDQPGEGVLQVQPDAPGLEIYTFTFGN